MFQPDTNPFQCKVAILVAAATSLLGSAASAGDDIEVDGLTATVGKHLPESEEGSLALLVTSDHRRGL